jgi:hypothetical protein
MLEQTSSSGFHVLSFDCGGNHDDGYKVLQRACDVGLYREYRAQSTVTVRIE